MIFLRIYGFFYKTNSTFVTNLHSYAVESLLNYFPSPYFSQLGLCIPRRVFIVIFIPYCFVSFIFIVAAYKILFHCCSYIRLSCNQAPSPSNNTLGNCNVFGGDITSECLFTSYEFVHPHCPSYLINL